MAAGPARAAARQGFSHASHPGRSAAPGAAVVAALALAVAGLVVNPTTTAVAAVPDLTFGVATGETRGIFVGQTGPYAVAINSSVPR